jgi:hypothetical protein
VNLHAQIGLITVPQEFTRLCNAILTAEYGDDYLPIDDDRADRGNDGYLKSEKRLFAAHCFKRIQNQGIDSAIRGKMIGDLGKAIALKREGIWDIEAWTFLSNYKVSEAIAVRLVEMGQEAEIDVSWRGPDEVASSLRRHKNVLEQFPELETSEINQQLVEIQALLSPLSNVITDTSVSTSPPMRAPRTLGEQEQLLLSRPGGWEYMLFAGVLYQGVIRLEPKWHDHQLRLPRGPRHRLDASTAPTYLSNAFGDLANTMGPINRVFDPSVQEQAFGAPGEAGNPGRIEHFARHVVATYEDMLDWAAAMRNLDAPEPLTKSIELAARFVDVPVEAIRNFVDYVVLETDKIPSHLAEPNPEPLMIELTLTLNLEDGLPSMFNKELKRAIKRL